MFLLYSSSLPILSLLSGLILITTSVFTAASMTVLAQNCTAPCNLSTTTNKDTNSSSASAKGGFSVTAIHLSDNQTGVAVNPNTNKIYVSLEDKLSVIDGNTNKVIKNITIAKRQNKTAIAVNPKTNMIYVGNINNTISVINGYDNSIVASINLRNNPSKITTNPLTNKVYVSYSNTYEISVIDGDTNNMVKNIVLDTKNSNTIGGIDDIAINPKTNLIYAITSRTANYSTNNNNPSSINSSTTVSVVDGDTGRIVKHIPSKYGGYSIDVDPVTNRIYVAEYDYISVIDGDTNSIIQYITTGKIPSYGPRLSQITINPTSKILYLSYGYQNLEAINATSTTVIGNVTLGHIPYEIAVNPITNTEYTVSEIGDNNIYSITQTDYPTLYNKGVDLLSSRNYSKALAAFNNAISIDPNKAAAWHNKGVALDKIGRYSQAVDSYNKAINIEPNNARHWDSKGTALYHLGRYQEALDSYNKAISIDQSNPSYQQNKNIALKQLSSQPNPSASNQGAQLNSTNSLAPAGGNMTSGNVTVAAPVPNATGVFGNVTAPTAGGNMTGTTTTNAPTTQQNTAFRTYENKRLGFKIQYPSGWIATGIPDLPTIFFSPHNDSGSSLIVSHQDRNPKFTKNPIESLSSLPNFKLIGSRLITLDGKSAQMIVYTERQGHKNMQVVLVANDGTYYNFIFGTKISTYDHYFPIVKTILDSFQTVP